jgi:hypothetical protein
MTDRAQVVSALQPLLNAVMSLPMNQPQEVQRALATQFPIDGAVMSAIRTTLRTAIEARSICTREAGGVRFERIFKPTADIAWSIDVVHMNAAGPGHRHPGGEVDVCFAVDAGARFDQQPEGFVVYGPDSWHVPTVSDGRMDIVYFLPAGAIVFDPS